MNTFQILSMTFCRMAMCVVCLAGMDKVRVHYGGVSCYPCRQFFRRVTNSGETKTCTKESPCPVRMCKACRYMKCLEAGMRPDMVMGPEERRERFQKDHESNQYDMEEIDDPSDASLSSPENFEFPENDDNEDYSIHESTLDPETGLMTGLLESPENVKTPIHEGTSNYETSFEQDLLSVQSLGYHHKKYRTTLVAEAPKPDESVTVEDVLVHQKGELQPNLVVMLKRSRSPESR